MPPAQHSEPLTTRENTRESIQEFRTDTRCSRFKGRQVRWILKAGISRVNSFRRASDSFPTPRGRTTMGPVKGDGAGESRGVSADRHSGSRTDRWFHRAGGPPVCIMCGSDRDRRLEDGTPKNRAAATQPVASPRQIPAANLEVFLASQYEV